jgi:hypothetical protein
LPTAGNQRQLSHEQQASVPVGAFGVSAAGEVCGVAEERRTRLIQAVDDVIAKHQERIDARKEEDLAFLRKLRANLVESLGRLPVNSKREGSEHRSD